jgi:hypothetical protein
VPGTAARRWTLPREDAEVEDVLMGVAVPPGTSPTAAAVSPPHAG